MIQSIETTGKTTEDALKAALAELGLTRDEVSVEIVTMPKSGFFGIGAVPAKLRVSFDDGRPEPQAVPEREKKPAAEKKPAPARNPGSEKKPAAAKAPKAKIDLEKSKLEENKAKLESVKKSLAELN